MCAVPLATGYACPAGTGVLSAAVEGCGSPLEYCPEGSATRSATPTGYYAVATLLGLYYNATQCEPGQFCIGGVAKLCPAGRFGTVPGHVDPDCEGNCSAGFFCNAGSTSQTQDDCSFGPGYYCPAVRLPIPFCLSCTDALLAAIAM